MENYQSTLNKIADNASAIHIDKVKQVLVLFEDRLNYLGDCCMVFDKLKYFRSFFNNATITVVATHKQNDRFYNAFLINNPHLDGIATTAWSEVDYQQYDVVICAIYNEKGLLTVLHEKYGDAIINDQFKLAVFSLSELLLPAILKPEYIFPVMEDLVAHFKVFRPGELYISESEREWANSWLESNGVKETDNLFIVLDSTSNREKLIGIDVYFDILTALLNRPNAKVLIFDEKSIGKEVFYREWLGDKYMEKIIFSKSLSLREDLCLLGAKYTKLVFGPCTGLLHCASSIYNNYVNKGMSVKDVPLMVTYTGQYADPDSTANRWWGGAPLVNCLLLKKKGNSKEIVLLHNLTEEEKKLRDQLPCSEYTAEILIDFLNSHIKSNKGQLNYN
jgi:hypothetical protein